MESERLSRELSLADWSESELSIEQIVNRPPCVHTHVCLPHHIGAKALPGVENVRAINQCEFMLQTIDRL